MHTARIGAACRPIVSQRCRTAAGNAAPVQPQGTHLGLQCGCRKAVVEDHGIGDGTARGARCLLGDHAQHLLGRPARTLHHTLHLRVLAGSRRPARGRHAAARRSIRPAAARRRPPAVPLAKPAWRWASSPIIGCRMASSALTRGGIGEGQRAHACAVQRAVGGDDVGAESLRAASACAAPPGAVSARAMASVSTSSAPQATSIVATVLLPLPMPPVRPTCSGWSEQSGPNHSRVSAWPKNMATMPPPTRKGPKGTVPRGLCPREGDEADADHRTHAPRPAARSTAAAASRATRPGRPAA